MRSFAIGVATTSAVLSYLQVVFGDPKWEQTRALMCVMWVGVALIILTELKRK